MVRVLAAHRAAKTRSLRKVQDLRSQLSHSWSYVEQTLAKRGERVPLVETFGLDDFGYMWMFHRKHGDDEGARIREFYKAGKVFRSSFLETSAL